MSSLYHQDSGLEQYTYSFTVINGYCQDTLNIEVKGKVCEYEFYYQQLTYEELSDQFKEFFENLNNLCTYINYQGTWIFDSTDIALKIYVQTEEQIKELVIDLNAQNRLEALKQKLSIVQDFNAKIDKYHVDALVRRQNDLLQLQNQLSELQARDEHVSSTWERLTTHESFMIKKMWTLDNQCGECEKQIQKRGLFHTFSRQDFIEIRKLRNTLPLPNPLIDIKIQAFDVYSCQNQWSQHDPIDIQFWERKKSAWVQRMRMRQQKLFPRNDSLVKFFLNTNDFQQQIKFKLSKHPTKTMKFVQVFANAEKLCLKECKIHHIKGLVHLRDLRVLKLPGNNIKRINHLNYNLKLEELDLSNNRILQISGIFHLTKLKRLKLNHNKIDRIPQQMEKLIELAEIHLHHNWIMKISRNVVRMPRLKYIGLLNNRCSKKFRCQLDKIIDKLIQRQIMVEQNLFE